jgi:hypothetical protein
MIDHYGPFTWAYMPNMRLPRPVFNYFDRFPSCGFNIALQ